MGEARLKAIYPEDVLQAAREYAAQQALIEGHVVPAIVAWAEGIRAGRSDGLAAVQASALAITSERARAAPSPSSWLTTETMPRDGTVFQTWVVREGSSDEGVWFPRSRIDRDGEFQVLRSYGWDAYAPDAIITHWMPAPPAPTGGA